MMRRIGRVFLLTLLAAGVSCAHRPAESLPDKPQRPIASTQPALTESGAPPRPIVRLTKMRWVLCGLQHEYLLKEGAAHRGASFAKLVNGLRRVMKFEPPLTEVEVLEVLGWPDYEKLDRHGGAYAYVYSDRHPEDVVARVQSDADGTVILVDIVARDAADLHLFHQYKPWPEGKYPGLDKYIPKPGSGFLGVQTDDGRGAGITINTVLPDSPAAAEGLQVGDVILRLGNVAVGNEIDFIWQVADVPPGQSVVMRVRRAYGGSESREFDLPITVGSRPAAAPE